MKACGKKTGETRRHPGRGISHRSQGGFHEPLGGLLKKPQTWVETFFRAVEKNVILLGKTGHTHAKVGRKNGGPVVLSRHKKDAPSPSVIQVGSDGKEAKKEEGRELGKFVWPLEKARKG